MTWNRGWSDETDESEPRLTKKQRQQARIAELEAELAKRTEQRDEAIAGGREFLDRFADAGFVYTGGRSLSVEDHVRAIRHGLIHLGRMSPRSVQSWDEHTGGSLQATFYLTVDELQALSAAKRDFS